MKFKIGSVEYLMRPGDSLYFDSLEEHGMIPLSDYIQYLNLITE